MPREILYGLGRRGVAIHPPHSNVNMDDPIPLWHDIKVPQKIIEDRGPAAAWHVIRYEVRDGS